MGYVDKNLGPEERVLYRAKLHWIVYKPVFVFLALGAFVWIASQFIPDKDSSRFYAAWGIVWAVPIVLVAFLQAWTKRVTTEIVVTSLRLVVKVGFVWRTIMEMNAGKIESMIIEQSVLGRLLGYGTVVVKGTGAGIEPVPNVAHPLKLRGAVAALREPRGYLDAGLGQNPLTRHEVLGAPLKPARRHWIGGVVLLLAAGIVTAAVLWKMPEQQPAGVLPPMPQRAIALTDATPAVNPLAPQPQNGEELVPRRSSEKPSFDCANARTEAARLICADGELARLDGELGAAFQKRKLQLPAADKPKFVADELAWIRDRNERCGLVGTIDASIEELAASKPCMVSAIRERIVFLFISDLAAVSAPAREPMSLLPAESYHPTDAATRCETIQDKQQRDTCFEQAGVPIVDCSHARNADDIGFCRQVLGTAAANQNTIPLPPQTAWPASPSAAQAQPPAPPPSTQAQPYPNQIAALLDKRDPAMIALEEIAPIMANSDSKQLISALADIRTDPSVMSIVNCASIAASRGTRSAVTILQNDCSREYLDWFPTCAQTTKACVTIALFNARIGIEAYEQCLGEFDRTACNPTDPDSYFVRGPAAH